jgi:predicted glycosyltransferase involved in capsule biosynthesis
MDNPTSFNERLRNIVEVMYCLCRQTYKNVEVILVEQYSQFPVMSHMKFDTNYVYVPLKHDMFNISWCHNVGSKAAKGDLLLHYSADVVVGDDYIETVLSSYEKDYIFGWSKLIALSNIGTDAYLKTRAYKDTWEGNEIQHEVVSMASGSFMGGSCMFERDFFFNVLGGYNEGYFNWGCEDVDTMLRTQLLSGTWRSAVYTLLHLYHSCGLPGGTGNDRLLAATYKYTRLTSELIKMRSGNILYPSVIYPQDILFIGDYYEYKYDNTRKEQ